MSNKSLESSLHENRSFAPPAGFAATAYPNAAELAALRAARADRLQTSLNLALGSALASIGLTIPTVAVVFLYIGQPLQLGIDGKVKDALNGEPNELRPIYELVLAYEQGSWDAVTDLASQVGIERGDVPGLYLPAVEWANSSLAMTA